MKTFIKLNRNIFGAALLSWTIMTSASAQPGEVELKRARALIQQNKLTEALPELVHARTAFFSKGDWPNAIVALHHIADCQLKIINPDSALVSANKALSLVLDRLPERSDLVASSHVVLGDIFLQKPNYQESIRNYQKAIELLKVLNGDRSLRVADVYQKIRIPYSFSGAIKQAFEFDKMALSIYREAYGDTHPVIGKAYFNIGSYYYGIGDLEESVAYFEKAVDVYKKTVGDESMEVADVYRPLGRIYVKRGEWNKLLATQQKGLSIYEKHTKGRNPYIILFHWNIGDAYRFTGDLKKSLTEYETALSKAKVLLGEKHPGVASCLFRISEYHEAAGSIDENLRYCHLGIVAVAANFDNPDPYSHPPATSAIDEQVFLGGLQRKALILQKKFETDGYMPALEAAAITYLQLDSLIDRMRQNYRTRDDKITLGRTVRSIYESAIDVNLELHRLNNDTVNLESAFYFSEKSRAAVLTDVLYDMSARGRKLIPSEVSDAEQKLKKERNRIRSAIVAQGKEGQQKLQALEDQLFNVNRRLDSLDRTIAKEFPLYHGLRNPEPPVTLEDSKNAIPSDEAMVHYFEGTRNVYVFVVTRKESTVIKLDRDSAYNAAQEGLISSLHKKEVAGLYTEDSFREFSGSANIMFKVLLKQPLSKLQSSHVRRLLIIPDGSLAYIPFEVLLVNEAGENRNYASLDFLLNQYAVHYGYSASLQFNSPVANQVHSGDNIVSFAPEYNFGHQDSVEQAGLGSFRDAIGPLTWNVKEAESIHREVQGKFYVRAEATEARFKNEATEYDVIHLAMHALIDDEDPMNSRLLFSAGGPGEDGYLHAFELYNMELHARMVVLSACNTAYGKLANGEGIMSLARGFAYAGVPAAVVSHWKVDDESTYLLMKEFYAALKDGQTKSEALRSAKLAYLNTTDPTRAHPAFWAAFVSIGDDEPVFAPGFGMLTYLLSFLTVAAIAVVTILRRRNSREK